MDNLGGEKNNRILVVDDNESIHTDFQKILSPRVTSSELSDLAADLFGSSPKQQSGSTESLYDLDFASQGIQGVDFFQDSPEPIRYRGRRCQHGWLLGQRGGQLHNRRGD